MSDYVFKAFIVNTADYESAAPYTGEWLYFPTDTETVKNTLAKIGLPENASPDTYFFDEYIYKSGDNEPDFRKKASIDEVNYISVLLGGMSATERNTFDAVLETREHTANMTSLINLAHNIDCYNLVCDMYSWENVGSYIAEQQGFGAGVIGDLADYIDYEAYGKDYAERNRGHFLGDAYLERVSTDFEIKYNGEVKDIPPEYQIKRTEKQMTEKEMSKNTSDYIFKAFIVNSFEYDNGNKETSGAWLYFPTDAETVKRTFEEIGLSEHANPDTYFFDDYVCDNEDLKKCFSQYESVDALNYLAERITELEDVEMTVFQTALEAGECKDVTDAINLTYNTECYEVLPDISDYDDLGRNLLLEQDIVLGELCEYFDLEAYAMETERNEGGKLLNGVYLRPGCAEFRKVYEGNTVYIPSEYRVTSIEWEPGYSAEKFNHTKQLAGTLHRFFLANDKNYAAEYSSPDNVRELYLADCLMNGKLDYIKSMLDDLGQTEKDVLPAELAEYEKVFLQKSGNHLENAEKSEEQNYNRIDGIINNTDKKPSIKEQLKAISNERPKSDPQQHKNPREETR